MSENTKETKAADTKSIAQLEKENKELQRRLAQSQEALKVAEATKGKGAKPVVKLGADHYEVVGGELLNGKRCTREELAKNEARLKELHAAGSGLLRKVKIS